MHRYEQLIEQEREYNKRIEKVQRETGRTISPEMRRLEKLRNNLKPAIRTAREDYFKLEKQSND